MISDQFKFYYTLSSGFFAYYIGSFFQLAINFLDDTGPTEPGEISHDSEMQYFYILVIIAAMLSSLIATYLFNRKKRILKGWNTLGLSVAHAFISQWVFFNLFYWSLCIDYLIKGDESLNIWAINPFAPLLMSIPLGAFTFIISSWMVIPACMLSIYIAETLTYYHLKN